MRRALAVTSVAVLLVTGCGGDDAEPAATAVPEAEDVSFDTPDGVRLTGVVYGEGPVGVVLAHMLPASDGARSWREESLELADLGYRVLAFNARGYVDSEGEQDPAKIDLDIRGAYDYLVERDVGDVALVGASMGGTGSIVVAAETPVSAVVAISAPVRLGALDAAAEAPDIEAPVLLMAAEGDEPAADALGRLGELIPGSRTEVFEGSAHGTDLLEAEPRALETLVEFLLEFVPPVGAAPAVVETPRD